ncbi:RsbRD N-terminal domain-containing protein, partial [Desulfovibrio sp. OttesenSCG-928-I05]|nr:RsbRD N-terminal domain-containing protein [Desulfovibrio sp. OttesenSCG-928-I05]
GRAELCSRWAESADAVYPFAAAGLLRTLRDPFANPVGGRTKAAASLILSGILDAEYDDDEFRVGLEEFLRVRAVQDMTPEEALAPVFVFKQLIREHLEAKKIPVTWELRGQLTVIEDRVDALALLAFGMYTRCRDAFHELRLKDVQRRHSQLLRYMQRHGLDDTEE